MQESDGGYVPIEGKVALIIDNTTAIINRGLQDDVRVGDIFAVLTTEGETVTDPDTKEIIGTIPIEKVRLKVTEVADKMSRLSTYRKVLSGGLGNPGLDLFGPRKEAQETFRFDRSEKPDIDRTVRIGDTVVEIVT